MTAVDETEAPPRARARARFVRMSPSKVRRVIDLIRGRGAVEALTMLEFAPQAAAKPVFKVLGSAIANAENNHDLDRDTLRVGAVFVDEGPTLKRFRPRAQGRAYRIRKRTSHITVEVLPAAQRGGQGRSARSTSSANRRAR